MRVYHERLTVPASWWVFGLAVVVLLGAELAAGFGWLVAAGIYLALGGLYAAMLISWGRARVSVAGGELRAGSARVPLGAVEEVVALDPAQTRAMRGPRADPGAFLLVRPYLRQSVYIRLRGHTDGRPYWLVGSRHPAALAAAVDSARATLPAGGPAMG